MCFTIEETEAQGSSRAPLWPQLGSDKSQAFSLVKFWQSITHFTFRETCYKLAVQTSRSCHGTPHTMPSSDTHLSSPACSLPSSVSSPFRSSISTPFSLSNLVVFFLYLIKIHHPLLPLSLASPSAQKQGKACCRQKPEGRTAGLCSTRRHGEPWESAARAVPVVISKWLLTCTVCSLPIFISKALMPLLD